MGKKQVAGLRRREVHDMTRGVRDGVEAVLVCGGEGSERRLVERELGKTGDRI